MTALQKKAMKTWQTFSPVAPSYVDSVSNKSQLTMKVKEKPVRPRKAGKISRHPSHGALFYCAATSA